MTAYGRSAQDSMAYGHLVVHRGGRDHRDDPGIRSRLMVWLLLLAVTMLFASLVSAYLVRMDLAGWQASPLPPLLWATTAVLAGASAALQAALRPAERHDLAGLRRLLGVAGALTLLFIVGQLAAWRQMLALGYGVATNPFSSFFYLFTLIHGLHVLGGLVPWLRLIGRVRALQAARRAPAAGKARTGGPADVAPALRLCALYWHFLLAVWIVLFALMSLS